MTSEIKVKWKNGIKVKWKKPQIFFFFYQYCNVHLSVKDYGAGLGSIYISC